MSPECNELSIAWLRFKKKLLLPEILLDTITAMKWIIDKLDPDEECVYLRSVNTHITRKFSVPGACKAWLDNGVLLISAVTGYLWQVDPDTGSRRRKIMDKDEVSLLQVTEKSA